MGPRNKLAKITGGFLSIFYCCKLKDGTVGPKMPSVTDDVTFRSKFCEFDSCALSRKASRHKRFAKIPSLQLIYVIGLFRSLHKMHDHRWGSEQIMFWKLTALRWLNDPVLWPRKDTIHAILSLRNQPMYRILVLLPATLNEHIPKELELLDLLQTIIGYF